MIICPDYLRVLSWAFEEMAFLRGFSRIAGVDEVGRGSLAGPVVSAAVILPERVSLFPDIDDSKKITSEKRESLYDLIYDSAVGVGLGIVDTSEIDQSDILKASLFSMFIAVENLYPQPDYLLVDGIFSLPVDVPQSIIRGGDSSSLSIGAASIVAKVTRDRIMSQADLIFPEFGFAKNKGYPTKYHKNAISRFGDCCLHRRTFNRTI